MVNTSCEDRIAKAVKVCLERCYRGDAPLGCIAEFSAAVAKGDEEST